jgi:hypothetical protein
MTLLLTRHGTHCKPSRAARAWFNVRRAHRAVKHLVPERANLPLRVRVPLTLAAPALAMPGCPDGGWDETWVTVALAMLAIFPSVRRRTGAVMRSCWATAGAEMAAEPAYCGWCTARWEAKQARRRMLAARAALPRATRARLAVGDLAAAVRGAGRMARAEITELAHAVRAELAARFTRNGRR